MIIGPGITLGGGILCSNAAIIIPGQISYTTPGTYSWIVPDGVTLISAVLVGAGGSAFSGVNGSTSCGGGGGAGLRYINMLPVTPGETLTVVVGQPGTQTSSSVIVASTPSRLLRGANLLVQADAGGTGGRTTTSSVTVGGGGGGGGTAFGAGPYGGTIGGGNGGDGGSVKDYRSAGGGGAGGYSGNGGNGGSRTTATNLPPATNGTGGGGAGGTANAGGAGSTGGGGVGLLGEGTSGVIYGGGGSGGSSSSDRYGGQYGAGGAGEAYGYSIGTIPAFGASGAVRIIWGTGRLFPSTNTGNM